jgi:hypothetical protein
MKTIRDLMLAGFCCLFLVGCSDDWLVTVPADKPIGPETVWTVLADYVKSCDVSDSTKLELIVKRLRTHGDIDDNAVDKFYAAFPDIKTKEIAITPQDADKIRGL